MLTTTEIDIPAPGREQYKWYCDLPRAGSMSGVLSAAARGMKVGMRRHALSGASQLGASEESGSS